MTLDEPFRENIYPLLAHVQASDRVINVNSYNGIVLASKVCLEIK